MKVFRHKDGRCYHIPIKKGEISNNLISCGSPERVRKIGNFLKGTKVIAENRGFICVMGDYKGVEVTAFNTGIGTPSAAIVLLEVMDSIIKKGNVNLIRVGTAGSLQSYVKPGHLVVAPSAVREEGTTWKWIFPEYPATASMKMSLSLIQAATNAGFKIGRNFWIGVIHVKDDLYAVENPNLSPMSRKRFHTLEAYKRMGVLATEMEFSAYAVLASKINEERMLKKRFDEQIDVGCLDLVLSPEHTGLNAYATTQFLKIDQTPVVKIGLEALLIKNKWDKEKRVQCNISN